MPNLQYSDKHNMVAFLKKPTESVSFTEIVAFLKASSFLKLAGIYRSIKSITITEASIRSQLQLADATCIINLSDVEIYEGLATLGAMDSGNIHESPLRSYEAPLPEGNKSRSVEDSFQLKELMAIIHKMLTKIDSLEKELKETKQTLGHAVLTLVKKVKSLKVALKRMLKRVILSDSEDEETRESVGRIIQDIVYMLPLVSLLCLSSYKRRTRSANKDKDIGTGMDFFNAAKERLNSAKVEVSTEVNPEAMRLQALQDEEDARQVHLDALLAKRIQKEQELSEQQQKRKA
ncbi:hypothetical protein Tco_1275708 [Tanacetum coccineum]